ncbi:hypothetical protein KHP60_04540 [Microvirga sp. 3-52]|uniref:hypothetical protein n=1 Tax=Microvirga sp. 3-52 TaxID=2792425 RepID=UPI001AD42FD7|nr:hypothetical protein [Microvirga sp. 3-52]MBO1904003.1 hypothetical protein [Microvirga sp. 3-52]MBS7451614.1 hypothetical protein [Microvirga sp. 3-52]
MSDHISHGTPEMLLLEISAAAAGAAFHAEMAARYAEAGNVAGSLYALRCLVACTKAAAATGKDLRDMNQGAQSHAA